MKKKMSRVFAVLLMALLCASLMAPVAFAEGEPSVSVPVEITLSGTLPYPAESYVIMLVADDPAYPMPDGAKDGSCSITVTGKGAKNFPPIVYDRVGIYTYTVYQVKGTNPKCSYDAAVYSLKVFITNAEDGSGLEETAILRPVTVDETGKPAEKCAVALFHNQYELVPEANPRTGDTSAIYLYSSLSVISLAAIATIFSNFRKRRSED